MEAGGEAEGASSGILEDASIAVLVLDGGAQVVQTLGRARDLTGIEAGDGIAAAPDRLREALEAALAHPGRSEVVALDGRMLEIRCDPARPSFVIAVDVTTHLREHQDARRRERQLRLMFAQVPAAAWATNRDLRITHVLGQVAREIGLDERSIPGMSIFDVTGARDATDPAVAHHRAALLGERSSFRYVLAERCYDVHVAPLRDDRDQIVGCVGAAVDVTA
ncbi:MAG TPA: PAS domain-containing protein, partial [Sandaracinaceae bacterium]